MDKVKLKQSLEFILFLRRGIDAIRHQFFIKRKGFGNIHPTTQLGLPLYITKKENVYLDEYTRIQTGGTILTVTGKFILKKYSAIASRCTIITGNHIPTVGIPQTELRNHPHTDAEKDIIVEEDVWIGSNVTLLAGAHIGRGAVIGACSLVNKEIPPYAIAVGTPAKIIAVKFTKEQIIRHEMKIYPENERLTPEFLDNLFEQYYQEKRSIGVENKEEA